MIKQCEIALLFMITHRFDGEYLQLIKLDIKEKETRYELFLYPARGMLAQDRL